MYEYNFGLLMYRYHYGWLAGVFDIFKKNSDKYEYRTCQAECPKVLTFTIELGIHSFKFRSFRICNNIFKFLKVDIKIGTFKKHLKTFLIKK